MNYIMAYFDNGSWQYKDSFKTGEAAVKWLRANHNDVWLRDEYDILINYGG